jgi:hypothetical protein
LSSILPRQKDARGTSPPKWTKHTTQKVYVGHLHHYSKAVPMIWDPKTKLVSPQFHVMFDDNFNTVQGPDPNVKITDTMDRLFKTNSCKYDNPFGNKHTYLFYHGGVDMHPDKLSPNLETCQKSMTMTSTHDDNYSETPNNPSNENTHNNKSILSMQDLVSAKGEKKHSSDQESNEEPSEDELIEDNATKRLLRKAKKAEE